MVLPIKGQTIELVSPMDDPNPIPVGSRGKVTDVRKVDGNEYQISVDWNSGRRLMLIYPVDEFEIIE